MKLNLKVFLLLMVMYSTLPILAQSNMSLVKLKSGVEMQGVIKYINPADAMILEIGGVETAVKMADVQSVEQIKGQSAGNNDNSNPLTKEEKLRVTDKENYPETYNLKVGDETVKMILVRGGEMYMGFDGPRSIFMDTEPVHKVRVTSFYMSERCVTNDLVNSLNVLKKPARSTPPYYRVYDWKVMDDMVKKIADVAGLPVRMPTEAEWEYAVYSPSQYLFQRDKLYEYCSDYFDLYSDIANEIDPVGPPTGKRHVLRGFAYNEKYDRSRNPKWDSRYACRLVIKAKDIVK